MIVHKIIVDINITGSIISKTEDNILLPSICGGFEKLPVIVSLVNSSTRLSWHSQEYGGSTTPDISFYIVVGNKKLQIKGNQLREFVRAMQNSNIDSNVETVYDVKFITD